MNQETQHFMSIIKNNINKLDLELMRNKPDTADILKTIGEVQKATQHIKNLVKIKISLDEPSK